MTFSAEKEQKLIEEAKQDSQRFAVLYDKYFDQIYRYVFRRVSDTNIAEDLVSQTFYDALSHLKGYEFRGYPFSSWLYKIAHNNVLKWYRQNSKNTIDLSEAKELVDKVNLVEQIKGKEEQSEMGKILNQLEEEDRELVRLKFFEEVSNIEIAEIMGISANNVGVKLYRALKRLKQLMNY